jgi:hypothetical protein
MCARTGFSQPPFRHGIVQQMKADGRSGNPASSGIRVTLDNPEPQVIDGERKTVIALFADIKGSTELMRDLIPKRRARLSIRPQADDRCGTSLQRLRCSISRRRDFRAVRADAHVEESSATVIG